MPGIRRDFEKWEQSYWLNRYQTQIPMFQYEKPWRLFLGEVEKAHENNLELKQEAEAAGFRYNPSVLWSKEQVIAARLPYLIEAPNRKIKPIT